MAKKLSRKKRKEQKKKQLRQQLLQMGYKPKQIVNKKAEDLQRYYTIIENERKEKEERERQERARKDKRNIARKNLHRRKIEMLENMGFEFARNIPESQTRKIKLSDIESGNVSRETFSKYDTTSAFMPFNYDKKYTLPDNISFYVAFRDYSGNQNIKEVLIDQRKKSNEQLLEELKHWNNTPKTYTGKSGTSSGSAGDMVCIIGDSGAVRHTQLDAMAKNRNKKTREHSGEYKGFQSIKLGNSVFNKEISMHEILVIATSIMPNVTEEDRKNFYNNLYNGLRHAPEIQKRLPKPQ